MVQVRQENKEGVGDVLFVIIDQFLSSRFLRFVGPVRGATLNDNTVLILRFA